MDFPPCAVPPTWPHSMWESTQTGHSTYPIFAQGCPRLGLPGNYQMLLWLCREARSLREGLVIAFWPWGAVLDKLLYNHCTIQPAEQHCNIFLLSSCSFGGSYLISFIHVNVSKNAAASACRMAPIVPFVRASGLFLSLLCPFLQRDKLCIIRKYFYCLILNMSSAMEKAEGIRS